MQKPKIQFKNQKFLFIIKSWMENDFQKFVLSTLAFFDVLDFAPTSAEIHEFLYRGSCELRNIQGFLKSSPYFISNGKYFALKNREELLALRETKKAESERLWRKAKRWRFLFKILPFVKSVAVCNNLALNNATEKSDIDLFIITKRNRMFLARLIATAILHSLRLRRHGRKIAGRFCLSFWLSEDKMDFESLQIDKEDIYLAFWMKSLKPITGYEIFKKFMQINCKWLSGYFHCYQKADSKSEIAVNEEKSLLAPIDNFIGKYQLKRIEQRKKLLPDGRGINASCGMLKFHDNDRRYEFREEFLKRIKYL